VNYAKQYGSPVKITRPFNIYGPGLHPDDGRVIPDFFRDLIRDGHIKLYSDGRATRSFCYISDALNGFIRTLVLGKPGEAYNIGNQTPEINMHDLAGKIIAITGVNAPIRFEKSIDPDYLTDNPTRRCPSIEKAINELGYLPALSLDEGLRLTYSYYKQVL